MAGIIYGLCAVTSLACACLLMRSFSLSGTRFLLWSGLCFTGLALNNIFLVLDRLVFPNFDLSIIRLIPALIGMMLLIFGLVLEGK